jgi:dCTP deaminase
MPVMSDRWIRRMAVEHHMIEPFEARQVSEVRDPLTEVNYNKVISFGTSSYGYDIRVGTKFKVFTNVFNTIVDPKNFDPKSFVDMDTKEMGTDHIIVPPNSFALAQSIEHFRVPRDILIICLGKSTYARCGIIVNVTPFEPEWTGYVTLEISNTTPLPAKIYACEGLAQALFLQGNEPCEVSYKDKKGKYQGQTEITLPKV